MLGGGSLGWRGAIFRASPARSAFDGLEGGFNVGAAFGSAAFGRSAGGAFDVDPSRSTGPAGMPQVPGGIIAGMPGGRKSGRSTSCAGSSSQAFGIGSSSFPAAGGTFATGFNPGGSWGKLASQACLAFLAASASILAIL